MILNLCRKFDYLMSLSQAFIFTSMFSMKRVNGPTIEVQSHFIFAGRAHDVKKLCGDWSKHEFGHQSTHKELNYQLTSLEVCESFCLARSVDFREWILTSIRMGKSKSNSKAAEKKRERLELEKKMNSRVQLVKAANKVEDPLENLPSFKVSFRLFLLTRNSDLKYDFYSPRNSTRTT